IPKAVTGVPAEVLNPAVAWQGTKEEYSSTVTKLANLFNENFAKYADQASEDVIAVGPKF
ncbi:Protein kinase C-like 1, partial [Entomortierella beljakovae]